MRWRQSGLLVEATDAPAIASQGEQGAVASSAVRVQEEQRERPAGCPKGSCGHSGLCGQLEALTMAYCRELTGMGLVQGLAGSMNYTLQELHLEETIFLDESSMCQLLERLPNLRRLSLDNCRQAVTDRTMATICQ